MERLWKAQLVPPWRCKKWLEKAGRLDLLKNIEKGHINYELCSAHFADDQFKNRIMRNRIIKHAIPTKFQSSWTSSQLFNTTRPDKIQHETEHIRNTHQQQLEDQALTTIKMEIETDTLLHGMPVRPDGAGMAHGISNTLNMHQILMSENCTEELPATTLITDRHDLVNRNCLQEHGLVTNRSSLMSRKNDMLRLIEDLQKTIEYIEKDLVNVSLHPQPHNNGEIWAIRGPMKNLTVMLHYQDQMKLIDNNDVGGNSIKSEVNQNFTPNSEANRTDININITAFASISSDVVDEVDSILVNVVEEVPCVVESVCSISENNDYRYSWSKKTELTNSSKVHEVLTYDGVTCTSNLNGSDDNNLSKDIVSWNEEVQMPEECESYNSLPFEITETYIETQNKNDQDIVTADDANVMPFYQDHNANTKHSVHQSDSDTTQKFNLKCCSVILEPLETSRFNKHIFTMQETFEAREEVEPNEGSVCSSL